MRLTTKIILGIILFVFVASLAFIVGFSFTDRAKKCKNKSFLVSQKDTITMQFSPYKVICFDYDKQKDNDKKTSVDVRAVGIIKVCPLANEAHANQLFFPKEATKFVSAKVKNDTLFVTVDRTQMVEFLKSKDFQGKLSLLCGVDFIVFTDSVDLKSRLPMMDAGVFGLHTDVIKLNVKGKAYIDSCVAKKIIVNQGDLVLKNTEAKQLDIDLDKVQNWTVNDCQIEEENLTGGKTRGYHRVYLPKKESKKMNWCPKDKDAKLEVKLLGDSAQVVFK